MKVQMAYGSSGLPVPVPDDAVVVRPRHAAAVADPKCCLRAALRTPVAGRPLRERVGRGARVAIAICDLTRPQPREAMVRAVLTELADVGDDADVTVLVATGTHRGNTPAELRLMLGDLVDRVRVVNRDPATPRPWSGAAPWAMVSRCG